MRKWLKLTREEWRERVAYHGVRWSLMAGVAGMTYVLFPVTQGVDLPRAVAGEVAMSDVVAPFTFTVPKAADEITREATELARQVAPIYDFRGEVVDSLRLRLDQFFEELDQTDSSQSVVDISRDYGVTVSEAEANYLLQAGRRRALRNAARRLITTVLTRGVAGRALLDETNPQISERRDGMESLRLRDSVLTRTAYMEMRFDNHPDATADQLYLKILNAFHAPSLVFNSNLTELRRGELRATVDSVKSTVFENERIISAHEIVTADGEERLQALQREMLRRGGATGASLTGILGQVLTNALIVTAFWMLLMLYIPETYSDVRKLAVYALLFLVVIVGSAAIQAFIRPAAAELIPIPFAVILLTVLFNGRIALVAAMTMAVLLGSQAAYGGKDAIYIALLGGVTAALSVRGVRRRWQILGSAALVTAAVAVAAITVGMRLESSWTAVGATAFRGAANAVFSASLVFFALPMLESLARVTTDMSLLELSDPSRPLLRRLATEVPGTYAHSLAVANLCEAGCNAIGANGLLGRVGCYYHDVGKMHRPIHFAENQGGLGNPHDRLPPAMSAHIIREHVVQGLVYAEEYRLPEAVKRFIPEHHGTGEITYFLDRARKMGPVDSEDLVEFSYPGPRPQTAETAVAMLADGVEAALRVLEDPTDKTVRDAIDHVVKQRVDDGQLDDAPLTLGQLERVKSAFMRVLSGMYHSRIEYPAESGGITAHWSAAAGA